MTAALQWSPAPATECGHLCELSLLNIILSVFSHNTLITVHNIVSSVETTGDVPSSVHTSHSWTLLTSQHHVHLLCSCTPLLLISPSCSSHGVTEVITHHHSTLTKHVPWSPGHGHVLSCSSGGGCLLYSASHWGAVLRVWLVTAVWCVRRWWPGHWQPDTGDPATTDTTATTAATHTGR